MTAVIVGATVFIFCGSIFVAIAVGVVAGAITGLAFAQIDNKYGGVDFSSAVATYVPIGIVGGVTGAISEAIPAEMGLEFAYNPLSDLMQVAGGQILNI